MKENGVVMLMCLMFLGVLYVGLVSGFEIGKRVEANNHRAYIAQVVHNHKGAN